MPKLYKREKSGCWYFKYFDTKTHKRRQMSTRCTDKDDAEKIMARFLTKGMCDTIAKPLKQKPKKKPILKYGELLELYTDKNTNPKYKDCMKDGRQYSEGYAVQASRFARHLKRIIKAQLPYLLELDVKLIDREDCKSVKDAILQDKGQCRIAEMYLQLFKVTLKQAVDDGLIPESPAANMPNIRHVENKRVSIDAELIAWLLTRKDCFMDTQSWAFFVLLATTGMRKGEALAFDTRKLNDNVYTLDTKISVTGSKSKLEKPKMNIVRVIPLPKLAMDAIRDLQIETGKSGRLFYKNGCWVQQVFDFVRARLKSIDPINFDSIWAKMTAHVLRHSCNTNLLIVGCNKMLVSTYLAWEHLDINTMQARYTHILGKSLQVVADTIDTIYGYELEEIVIEQAKLSYKPQIAND